VSDTIVVQAQRRFGTLSPLRYPGGKASLAGFFADLIDELEPRPLTYVEPYAGGAGAGVALLRMGLIERLVVNDFDPAVHAFWNAAVHHNKELVERVRLTPLSLDEWHHQRDIYRACDHNDPLTLGFAFFFLNRTNRSGILNAGVIGGQAQRGRSLIDARFNREGLVERLEAIGALEDRIEVSDLDGRTVIRKYATDPQTLLYIDPPYVQAGSRLYLNAFEGRDHKALAEIVDEITDAHWLVTYDQSPYIARLYQDHFQCELSISYAAHRATKATELLIASSTVAQATRRVWSSPKPGVA